MGRDDPGEALIEGGQQVHRLAVGAGVTGAPHRLAIHRDRPPAAPPVSRCLAGGVQPRIRPGPDGASSWSASTASWVPTWMAKAPNTTAALC